MGSLPNLHELGREEDEGHGFKPGPQLGHLCGDFNGALNVAEKSKILQRYSGHHRITKARSNPQDSHKIVFDDFMLEHMAAYSPISARSRFNLNFPSGVRRRESINSSIGATSVRRLLAVVRGGHSSQIGRHGGLVYTRRLLLANLIIICLCHLLCSAAYLPFLALQTSVSVWYAPPDGVGVDVNAGSMLLAGAYAVAAPAALLGPALLKKIGGSFIIAGCYGTMVIFYLSHMHPALSVTIPASLFLGLVQGLLSSAHISFLMVLSHRITGLFHEEEEESRQAKRTCIIRRIARSFQAAHDFGLILGSVVSAILISHAISQRTASYAYDNGTVIIDDCYGNSSVSPPYCRNATQQVYISSTSPSDYNSFLDRIFDYSEDNGRVCGSQACPISALGLNETEGVTRILSEGTSDLLLGVFAGASGAAVLLGCMGLDRIKMFVYQDPMERGESMAALRAVQESFKDTRLRMAAPLALFIGLEQAFIYSDFSKSYVVCTLGLHRLNYVFLAMGLLQSISAVTLSMLLRTIRRYYVVAVGFAFHGCLLMVLILWNPTVDDPALFYVISASWGVCNSIWEMLSFTLLTGQYADNWESAFAIVSFFKFTGLSLAFVFHGLLCNVFKLYALAFFLLVAVISFAWLEVRLENIRKIKNITRL